MINCQDQSSIFVGDWTIYIYISLSFYQCISCIYINIAYFAGLSCLFSQILVCNKGKSMRKPPCIIRYAMVSHVGIFNSGSWSKPLELGLRGTRPKVPLSIISARQWPFFIPGLEQHLQTHIDPPNLMNFQPPSTQLTGFGSALGYLGPKKGQGPRDWVGMVWASEWDTPSWYFGLTNCKLRDGDIKLYFHDTKCNFCHFPN